MPVFLRNSSLRVGRRTRLVAVSACLLLAAVCAVQAMHRPAGSRASVGTARDAVPVVIATHDLPAGQVLRARDLAVVRWPRVLQPPGAAARPVARVGARLACPIRAGEAVTDTRLVGPQLTDGLPAGFSAVAVAITAAHATELLHPGGDIELLAGPSRDTDTETGSGGIGSGGIGSGEISSGAVGGVGSVTIIAHRLRVLALLPGGDDEPASLVVAADQSTTLRIAGAHNAGDFFAVPISP